MSENLVIVSTAEQAMRRYNLKPGQQCQGIKTLSIVSGGDFAWVVTSKEPGTLQTMRLGLTRRDRTRQDYHLKANQHPSLCISSTRFFFSPRESAKKGNLGNCGTRSRGTEQVTAAYEMIGCRMMVVTYGGRHLLSRR